MQKIKRGVDGEGRKNKDTRTRQGIGRTKKMPVKKIAGEEGEIQQGSEEKK